MKTLALLLLILSPLVRAQEPAVMKNFDMKIYSLKARGVKEFVVDIENKKLLKQLNEQMTYGVLKELTFRTYWTSSPERLAIEVVGLPEGFREVKEELKAGILAIIDNLLPPTTAQRFSGYKFAPGTQPTEVVATDTTGIAMVPSYVLRYDKDEKLTEITARRPVGTMVITPTYVKEKFSDSRWVLESLKTVTEDAGHTITIEKELEYGVHDGFGVLKELLIRTEQKGPEGKPLNSEDEYVFRNYRINSGAALKYFLGEPSKT